jgi:hypothetical protein
MAKRKSLGTDEWGSPSSVDESPRMTKRVFRTNRVSITNATVYNGWTPPQHSIMSELLEFLITHEEAFKRYVLQPPKNRPTAPKTSPCSSCNAYIVQHRTSCTLPQNVPAHSNVVVTASLLCTPTSAPNSLRTPTATTPTFLHGRKH